jgi:hypothetical protein
MKLKAETIEPNPKDPFNGNLLFRNENAANVLTQIVKKTEGGFTLSINADWGYGKTTFIRMWKLKLQEEGYKTIYFNAWESDFVADPMMALIDGLRSGFEEQDLPQERLQKLSALWDAAIEIVKLLPSPNAMLIGGLGATFKRFIDNCFKNKNKLQKHQSVKKTVTDFREQLAKFAKEISRDKQLIIFIDELDRCRPDYAVQMLERIKHFFTIDNIIFVLSIDKNVICKSVKAIYGGLDIDTEAYLRRFVDLEFNLPKPNPRDYIKMLYEERGMGEYMETYWNWNRKHYGGGDKNAEFLKMMRLCFAPAQQSLRDIEKYIARLDVILRSFDPEDIPLSLVVLLVYFNMFHPDIYDCFREQRCGVKELWERILEAYLQKIHPSGDKQALIELLLQVLIYYCKWELYNDNYEAKDLSLRDIISHNDVSWLPAEHRNNFKERVEKAKIGNFELLFDRIELIYVDFDWKDLKGVMGA